MSNKELVIFAMLSSAMIMMIGWFIQNQILKLKYKKGVKRTKYIEQLIKDEAIPFVLINIDSEPKRLEKAPNDNGLVIDNKLYDDKNAYFLQKDNRIYVIGKKEDFMIALVGGFIGRV